MDLIPGLALLVVGSILGIEATLRMGQWNPFGKLPFFVGNPADYPFGTYMRRTVALFLLLIGGALLYVPISSWGFILAIVGTLPMWMLTRDHNRQVDKDFGPEWP